MKADGILEHMEEARVSVVKNDRRADERPRHSRFMV
jgi:hypothetical protein